MNFSRTTLKRSTLQIALSFLFVVGLLAFGAGDARAGQVAISNTELRYIADNGEVNNLTITQNPDLTLDVRDTGAVVWLGPGCIRPDDKDASRAECNAGMASVSIALGDGSDSADISAISLPAQLHGGEGDDTLIGGGGDDALRGAEGTDVLRGMGGADQLVEVGSDPDAFDGGDGIDTVTYDQRTDQLRVGLSTDAFAPSTPFGSTAFLEGDTYAAIENVVAGRGDDRLSGSSAGNTITGGDGADRILPRGGEDAVIAGAGDDSIDVRDGAVDTVQCGSGDDYVQADAGDLTSFDCEVIDGAERGTLLRELALRESPSPLAPLATTPIATLQDGKTISLKLQCPKGALNCGGLLTIQAPPAKTSKKDFFSAVKFNPKIKPAKRTIYASVSVKVKSGKRKTIRVRLTKAGRKAVASRAKKHKLLKTQLVVISKGRETASLQSKPMNIRLRKTASARSSLVSVAAFPKVLPDFSRSANPHRRLLSAGAARGERPMLVIVGDFTTGSGLPMPTDAVISRRFFGAWPSVQSYYQRSSQGRFNLVPAGESFGQPDGVVRVTLPNQQAWYTMQGPEIQNLTQIRAADRFINFAQFDRNRDGVVDDSELVVNIVTQPRSRAENCGAARGVGGSNRQAWAQIDGVTIVINAAMSTQYTDRMTQVHEAGHVALDMRDLYGFGVGQTDLFGPTCNAFAERMWDMSTPTKMLLGWERPVVANADGYYDIAEAKANGNQGLIAYSPAQGVGDFLVLENRGYTGAMDNTVSDEGLFIYRMTDRLFGSGSDRSRWIEIMAPNGIPRGVCTNGFCYSGQDIDAFDPGDARTLQSSVMLGWQGAPATRNAITVSQIPHASNDMRVYVDVEGPGVMITPAAGIQTVTPGVDNYLSATITNTGDEADTFTTTLKNLPPGWTQGGLPVRLRAGQSVTVPIRLTPSAGLTSMTPSITIDARSGRTIASSAVGISVRTVPRAMTVEYTAPVAIVSGGQVPLHATVRDLAGNGLGGVPVTFEVHNSSGQIAYGFATTGADGVATTAAATIPDTSGYGAVEVHAAATGAFGQSSSWTSIQFPA